MSDSDESVVAEFDELIEMMNHQKRDHNTTEDEFIHFIQQVQLMNVEWCKSVEECAKLKVMLNDVTYKYRDSEDKLGMSRKLFDSERKRTKTIQEERDHLKLKVGKIESLIISNNYRSRVPRDIQEQFAFLHTSNGQQGYDYDGTHINEPQLSTVQRWNTTGSILSDYSLSRSEDDLDVSLLNNGRTWKKLRPSTEHTEEPVTKKRRSRMTKTVEISSTDTVRATTTLTVPKSGPITATSIIESIPNETHPDRKFVGVLQPTAPPEHLVTDTVLAIATVTDPTAGPITATSIIESIPIETHPNRKVLGRLPREDVWQRNTQCNVRQHIFQTKTVVKPENCGVCKKRIGFGKQVPKCEQCRNICHTKCSNNLTLPCVPVVNIPTQLGVSTTIDDYTPITPPMVPALIIHCLNQIESRGLREVGIYRVPGSEREVQSLKQKFLHSKVAPNLDQIDMHVICSTVKSFLRSLSECLVTQMRWADFIQAVESRDSMDCAPILHQLILQLPQPNRDTLAYMLLHLKRVSESPLCKMHASNLSKVFGPTLIGYSSNDIQMDTVLITETRQITMVMEHFISLPVDFWSSLLHYDNVLKVPKNKLQQTPSTDSLLCQSTRRGFFANYGSRTISKTKRKIFPTPKLFK